METFGCGKSRQKSIIHVNAMSMFTEGGQRRELCSGNVSSGGGGGISSICIHAGAIPARLGNSKEVLRLPALSSTFSCSAAVPTAAILGTSALQGRDAGGFLLLPENVDADGWPATVAFLICH